MAKPRKLVLFFLKHINRQGDGLLEHAVMGLKNPNHLQHELASFTHKHKSFNGDRTLVHLDLAGPFRRNDLRALDLPVDDEMRSEQLV